MPHSAGTGSPPALCQTVTHPLLLPSELFLAAKEPAFLADISFLQALGLLFGSPKWICGLICGEAWNHTAVQSGVILEGLGMPEFPQSGPLPGD